MDALQSSYDPQREKRWSYSSFGLLCIGLFLMKRFAGRSSFLHFLKQVIPSKNVLKWATISLISLDYWNRFLYRFSNLRRIKIHHSRVLMALELFLLCQYVLQRSRSTNAHAAHRRLLIDVPMESDIDDDLKNASNLLVERVPLPAEYYDRSSEPFGFRIFKIGTNVLCASSAFAHSVVGEKNKKVYHLLGPILALFAIPYYAIRHAKAGRYTTRILIDQPNVEVIRMGWRIFGESSLMQLIARLQSPRIPAFKQGFVSADGSRFSEVRTTPNDIKIHLYSVRPISSVISGSWEDASTPLNPQMIDCGLPSAKLVLFYLHGGGWFGRFIAKDFYNLSTWATKLGAVIVYVGKSY